MDEKDFLAEQFQAHRRYLRAVAQRMLGTSVDADDAVQETWLRLNRSDTSEVENLRSWLTTVVARVCLDMLRSRRSRPEDPLGDLSPAERLDGADPTGPEQEVLLADSVGLALLVVLETLSPAERLAFVLHDLFAVPFDEIAPIVERTPAAARQLASRARRRVQGTTTQPDPDLTRQRQVVDAWLAASRGGDFAALLALLDPDVALRADESMFELGSPRLLRGAQAVAGQAQAHAKRSRFAQPALVDGAVGLAVVVEGRVVTVLAFTVEHGKIIELEIIGDAEHLDRLDLVMLG